MRKRHTSKINLEGMLRTFHAERNFHGVRAVFRAAGAHEVRDHGRAYFVKFPRYGREAYGKWVEWDDKPRRPLHVLEELQGAARYMTPEGT